VVFEIDVVVVLAKFFEITWDVLVLLFYVMGLDILDFYVVIIDKSFLLLGIKDSVIESYQFVLFGQMLG
jgi:hypothetical protein